ncbi:MAG: hypothetical protein M3O50_00275 [Myxococcota bacterium]|nr:hypothetical protein [Myxococcota bacterium]
MALILLPSLFGAPLSFIPAARIPVVLTAGGLTLASFLAVASCSSSTPSAAPTDAAVPAVTKIDAAIAADGHHLSCAPRPHANRCSGDDSTFVFAPPLACDPSSQGEAGTGVDAGTGVSSEGGPPAVDLCAGVTTLDVFFSPQACRAFVDAESSGNIGPDGDPSAPVLDAPADGDMLTPDQWSTFLWHRSLRDARGGPLRRAFDLLERPAYAYSSLAGDAYVIEFTQGCTEVLRAMVTGTFWSPDPASWALLTSLTGAVQVRVFAMRFAADTLVSKPVASAPITISMQSAGGG